MITLLKNIITLVVILILAYSCKNEKSLQQFMIAEQEKSDIISLDLSPEIFSLKDSLVTPENTAILKSIKKANIIAYQIDSLNKNTYLEDLQQLKTILKAEKYKELMRFGKGTNGLKIYAVGDENALDEVIAVGSEDTKGWILVRVIGDNMQPDKIMGLINDMKIDQNNDQLGKLKNLMKSIEK